MKALLLTGPELSKVLGMEIDPESSSTGKSGHTRSPGGSGKKQAGCGHPRQGLWCQGKRFLLADSSGDGTPWVVSRWPHVT